ncbi:nuclease [Methanococcoides sp. SA1]|nr:nuclease [Methanococcoides sp. SA1]
MIAMDLKKYIDGKWHQGTVVKCKDGDSFTLKNGIEIRLANVRAQEIGKPGAVNATRVLAGILGRDSNKIRYKGVDISYGRLVAEVRNINGSVNEKMREKGYTNKGR